ncbi:VWA domain-containing protein [Vibrio spartinae]|uniref:Tetratricopeptide repeat protein n=1 Tax=Vibrio spartinae TaxID=1918945 RepID=A0A1N6MBW6_9VIBR|nr:VWA domain-containing protein [Vibrio spartinae]SIO96860.1 Tetratricopeptide repeat protein [Vibrio spartinae]
MSDFVFLNPIWLIGLLPVALLLAWLTLRKKQQSLIAPHIAQALGLYHEATSTYKLLLLALCWTIAIVALSGPSFERQLRPTYSNTAARVLVMDMSRSMYATDNQPSRLIQARYKAVDLLKHWKEGVTGLVAYAGDAYTISPMTTDTATILNLLPNLTPEIMPYQGADAARGVKQAIQMMKNAGLHQGAIILITDELDANERQEITDLLSGTRWQLAILGMGSRSGAPIPTENGALLKTTQGQTVIAKANFNEMKSLAQSVHGTFISVQLNNQDVETLVDATQINTTEHQASGKQQVTNRINQGYWLMPLLLIPALMMFRKGLIFGWLALVISTGTVPRAQASPWLNHNQQAKHLFDAQDYQHSAEQFSDPDWKAAAYYRAKDYQQAIEALSSIQSPTPRQQYNLANAYAKHGDLQKAIDLYQQVLAQDPDNQDARHNLDVVKKAQQQQQKNSNAAAQNQSSSSQQQQNQSQQKQSQKGQSQTAQSQQDQAQRHQSQQNSQSQSQSQSKASEQHRAQRQRQNAPSKDEQAQNNAAAKQLQRQQASTPQQSDQASPSQAQKRPSDPEFRKLEQVENARDPSRLLRAELMLQAEQKEPPEDNHKSW